MVEKNRWLMALSAVGVHICIGSVYAWSVYVKPIQAQMNWDLTDVTIAFSIAIFFLGLSAALMGKFVEKNGPRVSAIIAETLGPFFSTNFPIKAALSPKKKIAILNALVTSVKFQAICS